MNITIIIIGYWLIICLVMGVALYVILDWPKNTKRSVKSVARILVLLLIGVGIHSWAWVGKDACFKAERYLAENKELIIQLDKATTLLEEYKKQEDKQEDKQEQDKTQEPKDED